MHNIITPHSDPVTAALDSPLPESVVQGLLDARKISSFYTHQVAAINALDQGKHVIVSTSTASGKSVIYQVCRHISHTPERGFINGSIGPVPAVP